MEPVLNIKKLTNRIRNRRWTNNNNDDYCDKYIFRGYFFFSALKDWRLELYLTTLYIFLFEQKLKLFSFGLFNLNSVVVVVVWSSSASVLFFLNIFLIANYNQLTSGSKTTRVKKCAPPCSCSNATFLQNTKYTEYKIQ